MSSNELKVGDWLGASLNDRLPASISEAGKMLSLGRTTIYRLIWDGKLDAVKIRRRTLIRTASIRRLAGEDHRSV
jgi:excisionase family DNA binding protein